MDRRGICTGKHVTEQACDERDMCTGKTYDQTDMQAEEICKMKRQVDWNGMCNEMGEGMSINIFKDTMAEMTYEQIEELVQKEAIVLFPVGIIEEHGPHLPLGTDIYLAYEQAHDVFEMLKEAGTESVIAPPFYLGGVQALTRHFPGTFAFSRDTIIFCVTEYLENLDRFGFKRVIFFNDHGDGLHIAAMVEAIRKSNQNTKLKAYWMEYEYELREHGFDGSEDYILKLTTVPFENMFKINQMPADEFDVHAGAFETATMREICPECIREEKLEQLKPTFLKGEQIMKWCQGEKEDQNLIPGGYVGDPAGSGYVETRLRDADRQIAQDIINAFGKEK